MTTPSVYEIPKRLEPVTPDRFAEDYYIPPAETKPQADSGELSEIGHQFGAVATNEQVLIAA